MNQVYEADGDDDGYGAALALAALFVGAYLADVEGNERRERRMRVALADQRTAFIAGLGRDEDIQDPIGQEVLQSVPTDMSAARATTFLIDLLFVRPFAPAELNVNGRPHDDALKVVARHVGLEESTVDGLRATAKSAEKAHRDPISVGRLAAFGGGAMVLLAITAGAAAPWIAGAIGGAAGLSGAAGLAYGMAALGFGSLAAGGLGMAGGLWIVTGAGALIGAVGGSAASVLMQLDVSVARRELVKLQTTVAEVTLRYGSKSDAASYAGRLLTERDEIRTALTAASERNEDDAQAVQHLRELEDALGDAIRWINQQVEKA